MAWRSGGTNNDEMVDNLKRFGVISTETVERGFRAVDRKFFVPKGNEESAHSDQPLKEGNVHISAPHIYGSALEALELNENSSLSFLNVGSGTGYLSCIVAEILGPKSVNFGVEIHEDVVNHCQESVTKWRCAREKRACGKRQSNSDASSTENDAGPHLHFIHGNGLNVSPTTGESVVGFDRIYVGAAVERSDLPKISKLLCPGGILVGPVDDELTKIVRIGPLDGGHDAATGQINSESEDEDADEEQSNNEFTQQVLSGVRFAPLLLYPVLETVIPARGWAPDRHRYFPDTFQQATMELLMCSNAKCVQPPPQPKKPSDFLNVAAMLPRVMWIEILSFTHRKWFEPEQTETEHLKQRLLEEQANAAKAQQARIEAEARCHVAERERDVYRLLARRWQSRLHVILQQQRQAATSATGPSTAASSSGVGVALAEAAPLQEGASLGSDDLNGDEAAALLGLGAMLRQITGEEDAIDQNLLLTDGQGDEEGSDDGMGDDDEVAMDTENADAEEEPQPAVPNQNLSGTKEIDDSVMMGEAENSRDEEGVVSREVRAVSLSSDDP